MNPRTQDFFDNNSGSGEFEETLRLIAGLPAPQGLEERVQAGVLARSRRGRVLAWPVALNPESAWMRAAAAAAIVFVVAGGGWGVYSRVQRPEPARVIVMPPRAAAPGGFSSADAMRRPQTLNGPVVAHPAAGPKPGKPAAEGAQPKPKKTQPTAANNAPAPVAPPQAK